jgi:hypothetical protein
MPGADRQGRQPVFDVVSGLITPEGAGGEGMALGTVRTLRSWRLRARTSRVTSISVNVSSEGLAGISWKLLEAVVIVCHMTGHVEVLEQRITQLRVAVREAVIAGDRVRAHTLREELRKAELAWDEVLAQVAGSASGGPAPPVSGRAGLAAPLAAAVSSGSRQQAAGGTGRDAAAGHDLAIAGGNSGRNRAVGPLLPLREQVHEALSLLTVPAAPRLIATVHEAFFAGSFPAARVTSLRRDEERSFRTAPFARPYYICAALTADLLAPARGLLAVSTWPMERRVIGSLSSRVDFLTAAVQVAEAIGRIPDPSAAASRLLWRFAASIPGVAGNAARMQPRQVILAARAELQVHQAADLAVRRPAAQRARSQLDDVAQLFGSRLRVSSPGGSRGVDATGGTAS